MAVRTDVSSSLDVTIHDTEAQLEALKPEWEALRARSCRHSGAQGHAYTLAAWRTLAKSPEVRLAIVAVRRDGVLTVLWPLYVRRDGLHTVACHLGTGACEEYAGPLVQDMPNDREAGELALRTAKGLADILRAYNLFGPGLAAQILRADRSFGWRSCAQSPVVSAGGFDTYPDWLTTLSRTFRSELRASRRRVEARGALAFERMVGPVDGPACIDWIFACKREWLAAHGVLRSWMFEAAGRDLYAGMVSGPASPKDGADDVEAYALKLDGRIIAAGIGVNGPDRLEAVTAAHDPAFNDISAGALLIAEWAAVALARGVLLDLRLTREPYKLRWSDDLDRFDTFVIACTPWGVAVLVMEVAARNLHQLRVIWGPRIKGVLNRRRKRRPQPSVQLGGARPA